MITAIIRRYDTKGPVFLENRTDIGHATISR